MVQYVRLLGISAFQRCQPTLASSKDSGPGSMGGAYHSTCSTEFVHNCRKGCPTRSNFPLCD